VDLLFFIRMSRPDISLHADEPLRAGLLRVADSLIQYAVGCIERPTNDRAEDVHVVRRSIKQLRAIMRLVRLAIGRAFFERENAHLRKAARRLAFARDNDVARQRWRSCLTRLGGIFLRQPREVLRNRQRLQPMSIIRWATSRETLNRSGSAK